MGDKQKGVLITVRVKSLTNSLRFLVEVYFEGDATHQVGLPADRHWFN